MATSYSLGSKWEEYLAHKVSSGDFNNKSEVLRAGLRLLEHQELKDDLSRRISKMEAGEFATLEDFNNHMGVFLKGQEKVTNLENN